MELCVKTMRVLSVGKMDSLAGRSRALMEAGFTVFSTDDPEQAIAVCQPSEFDLAIVGHLLSGREKQRLVRHFREKCAVPVLLVVQGPFLTTLRADAYITSDTPIHELVHTAQQLTSRTANTRTAG